MPFRVKCEDHKDNARIIQDVLTQEKKTIYILRKAYVSAKLTCTANNIVMEICHRTRCNTKIVITKFVE
jgi:hypothetical protein